MFNFSFGLAGARMLILRRKIQLAVPGYGNQRSRLSDNSHNIRLFHDQQVFAVDFDFGAAPFAE